MSTPEGSQDVEIVPEMAVAVQEKREMDLPSLFKLAEALVPTGFLPEAIRTPGQAVAIILAGRELGIGPMLALRSIGIIKGKVVLAADLQLAQFKKFGGKADFKELSEQKAILWLRHPNGDEHTETFTIEDAKRAGLVRAGGNWTTFPKAMLRSRAITAGLKSLGFEPTCGAYDPDEAVHFQAENIERQCPGALENKAAQLADAQAYAYKTQQLAAQGAKSSQPLPVKEVKTPVRPPSERNSPIPVEATPEQKTKFLTMLQPVKEAALAYAVTKGWILPDVEGLEAIPLSKVPTTQKQFQHIMDGIRVLMDGQAGDAGHAGAEPEEFTIKGGDEWFRDVIVPIPPKGMKRDDYLKDPRTINDLEKNELFGWWANFQPKSWTDKKGGEHPPSDADIKFREALDAAGEHYGFKVKD